VSKDEVDEIRKALKEVQVRDVLLQTVVTLVSVSGHKLTEERDLDQAKLGIEAIRALLPLCPEEEAKPVRDALAQLQMLYAREVQAPAPEGAQRAKAEEAERAKARSKIWTPPGT
jgi:hypothetical protein